MAIVLVVGTGRSGTTTTARVLAERLDVDMGTRFAMSMDETFHCYEEEGMWGLECSFMQGKMAVNDYRKNLRSMILYRHQIANGKPWGFKAPSLCYTLREWLVFLPELPHIIWAYRDTERVAKSFVKCYGMNIHLAHREIRHRLAQLKSKLIGLPCVRVDYTEQISEDDVERDMREFLSNKEISGVLNGS